MKEVKSCAVETFLSSGMIHCRQYYINPNDETRTEFMDTPLKREKEAT